MSTLGGTTSPQQWRLDYNITSSTIYHAKPTMSAMKNQWKTSSMYINNNSTERVPDETPVEFIPGSTASGIRRLHRAELTLPYGQKTTSMQWPPPITPANVPATIGSYQQLTYGGPHLRTFPPGAIAAGLGGIDPTQ